MSENPNIEYKESWRGEYLKWICGFANATGGKIYIGKNDVFDIEYLKSLGLNEREIIRINERYKNI